tara:strand:+ start:1477 stop:2415 length:939 start_codon:yes stop_codon:yes gene_type:complete
MFLKKIRTSITKIILPFFSKILWVLKAYTRTVNYLNEKRRAANNVYNFNNIIEEILKNEKLIGMDVGAQGGFNSDEFFSKKYNKFFDTILVDPFKDSLKREQGKYIIDKGLWSSKCKKELFILNKRPESSSMFEPDENSLTIYDYKEKDFHLFEVSKTEIVDCDTLSASLQNLKINNLDYLKIDTQGAELEILKGLNNLRPLLIKTEVQVFPMYKKEPAWTEIVSHLYKLDYIVIDWKKIGSSATRSPVEMDMIFIPNFSSELGKKIILDNQKKFISLMLITGQIKLLKEISKLLNLEYSRLFIQIEDKYYN